MLTLFSPCRTQLRRFRVYNLVGWGLPLTLTLITLILQYLPSTYTVHLITPGIGKEIITNCFKLKQRKKNSRIVMLQIRVIEFGCGSMLFGESKQDPVQIHTWIFRRPKFTNLHWKINPK